MRLGDAVELAVGLMDKHKIGDWRLELDNSASVSGWCAKRDKCIGLSRVWIKVCNKDEVTDTILHEIAHALVKSGGHNKEWKDKARELGAIPKAKVDRVLWLNVKDKIKKYTKQ